MPYADSNGARLYYEEAGRGTPVMFVHEFADDLYSWEAQLRNRAQAQNDYAAPR